MHIHTSSKLMYAHCTTMLTIIDITLISFLYIVECNINSMCIISYIIMYECFSFWRGKWGEGFFYRAQVHLTKAM